MKYKSDLAQKIYEQTENTNFGQDRSVKAIINEQLVQTLLDNDLHLDYRAKITDEKGIKSVFEGLDFDPENLRSQSFAIFEGEKAIGTMSIIIAPQQWIKQQRYIQNCNGKMIIVDYNNVAPNAEFYIIPARTNIIDSRRGKLAIPGVRTIKSILQKLIDEAPQNTYIETAAQSELTRQEANDLIELVNKLNIGDEITKTDFPYDRDKISKNYKGSNSTVKFAKLINLGKKDNIASFRGGPVFNKKIA